MKTTIDSSGRVVIPKEIRSAFGLNGREEIEVEATDDRIEITRPPRETKLVREPRFGLLVAEGDFPPTTPEDVRRELERLRR